MRGRIPGGLGPLALIGLCALACLVVSTALTASAQVPHAVGPPGNGVERHVIVALSMADGSCADIEEVAITAEGGVVEPRDVIGRCARWVRLEGAGGPLTVTLRHGDASVSTPVALGCEEPLALAVDRSGDQLSVDATEWTGARATGTTGGAALEGAGPRLTGPAPEGLGVVVAERDGCVAATRTGVASGPVTLVVPAAPLDTSAVALPTAIIAFTDGRGRPTRRVPNEILAEGGVIERFLWTSDDLGIVWIAPDPGAERVVVEIVPLDRDPVRLEIAVHRAWPRTVSLSTPNAVPADQPLDASASLADDRGGAIQGGVLMCDGEEVDLTPGHGGTCQRVDETGPVVLGLRVDDQVVPMDWRQVEVVAPVGAAETVDAPSAMAEGEPGVFALTLGLEGGIDAWGVPHVGGAIGLRLVRFDRLALGAELRYTAGIVTATGAETPRSELSGIRHDVDVLGIADIALLGDGFPLAARLGVGPTIAWDAFSVDGQSSPGSTVGVAGLAALGSHTQLGAVSLGARFGVRVGGSPTRRWDAPLLRFFLEVHGVLPL